MANEEQGMTEMIMPIMMMLVMVSILPSLTGVITTPPPPPDDTPAPPPPLGALLVYVKNAPLNGNYFQFGIFDSEWGENVLVTDIAIDDPAIFAALPAGFTYPLLVDFIIYDSLTAPQTVVHKMQSAYGSDWPDYLDVSIDEPGTYEYDVLAGTFGVRA